MSKTRDLINAHLYPVLATLGTVFLGIGMTQAIQINHKLGAVEKEASTSTTASKPTSLKTKHLLDEIVVHCNGSYKEPKTSLDE